MAELKGYTGISFPFRFNSKGGVTTSSTSPHDFSHIEESIQQILYTEVGERVMEEFGSKLRKHVFDNVESVSKKGALEYDVKRALEKYEDRIDVENVNVVFQDSKIIVSIDIFIEKYYANHTVNVALKRKE